jgi:hypothetical protein
MLLTLKGHSQNSGNDTTCLPNAQLKLALKKIEKGKLDAAELKLQQEQNLLLEKRLFVKDSIIGLRQQQVNSYMQLVKNHESESATYREEAQAREESIKRLQAGLRKERSKTVMATISGILSTTTLVYLLLK